VIGPEGHVREEMIKRLRSRYDKVEGVTTVNALRDAADKLKDERYTIGLVLDCTESEISLADTIKQSIGKVEILKSREPDNLEMFLKRYVTEEV
jgi:hypothetical protein